VTVEQPLKRFPARLVDRQQFVGAIAGDDPVAEHQLDLGGHRNAGPGQRVRVRGELQQRLDLDRPGQLRVAKAVPVVVEHQEVGEAEEAAVEHGGLVDDGRAAVDGLAGGLGGCGQAGQGVRGPADDDRVVGVLLVQCGAEFVEVALLVLVAE
jgi:hypothetical protein